jgi:hypothetical protein
MDSLFTESSAFIWILLPLQLLPVASGAQPGGRRGIENSEIQTHQEEKSPVHFSLLRSARNVKKVLGFV